MSQIAQWEFRTTRSRCTTDEFKNYLKRIGKHYVFQVEKGDSGYEHYQGRLSLIKKRRYSDKMKILELVDSIFEFFEPCSNPSLGQFDYVMKADTRIDGPYSDKDVEVYIPRQVREITTLRPWQSTVLEQTGVWDTRTINLIVDKEGGIGKSTLLCYLGAHGLARCLPPVNDMKDIMRMVMDLPTSRCYLIDMPRFMNKDRLYGFWSGIETLKNGYAYDDRYAFREKWFDCPNIWIFTNVDPNLDAMSMDRWRIFNIINDNLIRVL